MFGEPVPTLVSTLLVAPLTIALDTVEGEALVALEVQRGHARDVRVAIDVPLIVLVAVLLVYQAEVMLEPGANRSRQEPMLEKLDWRRCSSRSRR